MHNDIVVQGALADRLAAARQAGASDWHWSEQQGEWWRLPGGLVRQDAGLNMADVALGLEMPGGAEHDAALVDAHGARYRSQWFGCADGCSVSVRILAEQVRSLRDVQAPAILTTWTTQRHGLILVAGATGAGKSTTLAALLMACADTDPINAITLEDPIEQRLVHASSRIVQRELGRDFPDFGRGLRSALRQDPDVLLIGEIRDADTLRWALLAGQAGHLVMASLHAQDATQAVQRMLGLFNADERSTMRGILAAVLVGICVQEMHAINGARRVAFEVLCACPAVSALIREDRVEQLANVIATGAQQGMQSMSDAREQLRFGNGQTRYL